MKLTPSILMTFMSLLCGANTFAQIDLDHPVLVGNSDHVFRSAQDPQSAYFFPIALIRKGSVDIADSDRTTSRAVFQFASDPEELPRLQAELKILNIPSEALRYFRPNQVILQPGVDLPNPDQTTITPLNDFNFDGSSSIAIQIPSRKGLFRRSSSGVRLLQQLFADGSNNNVVIVRYEFSAVFGGKLGIGQTSVAIFTDTLKPEPTLRNTPIESLTLLNAVSNVLVDTESRCWNQTLPGKFCFRPTP